MECAFLIVCQQAEFEQRGLVIVNALNQLPVQSMPAGEYTLELSICVYGYTPEFNKKFKYELVLTNEDGATVHSVSGAHTLNVQLGKKVEFHTWIQRLHSLKFDAPGVYQFSLSLDDEIKATVPFEVRLMGPPNWQ